MRLPGFLARNLRGAGISRFFSQLSLFNAICAAFWCSSLSLKSRQPAIYLNLDSDHAVGEWENKRQPGAVNAQQLPEPKDNRALILFSHGERFHRDD
jgi:hypothetical protein